MEDKKKEEKPEEEFTEPESDFPEALLEYEIEAKETALDETLFDLKEAEKKNKECHKRHDLLKEEKQAHIRRILRQLEEEEKNQDKKEVVTRDDVEDSLKTVWQYEKDQEQLLKDIQAEIEETEKRISVMQAERDYWLEYKNVGSKTDANKIMNLEKDIQEVKDDLQRTTEYFRSTLKAMKEENDRQVLKHMELTKEQAPEDAVRDLDKDTIREIEENEWLKAEIKIYQKELSDLQASVQLLEEENISLVAKLVDDRLQEPRAPRHLFPAQAADSQDEFPKDEMKEVEDREHAVKADGGENLRSASVPCQKGKALAKTQSKREHKKAQDSDEKLREKFFTPSLEKLLYEDGEDSQEYLKLGPVDTRLLCVVGRTMPVHEDADYVSYEEAGTSGRHITARMIKALSEEEVS
ncbi:PREDICTED: coiled-coil domain-containing protein 83 [Chaetura pelagica]|uniref:coiled-coil domain-containing protein 83 n=1 Tax=Chaetura pelagica TaxID=8897 RepID=UPI000523D5E2|nr:PREDICTED: coiled-coil domain-containing protein 83 [Chaetura pelagica]